MALRQHQRFVARDGAQHRNAERLERIGDQRAMPVAAELVEHDAADAHRRIVGGEARGDRGRRLRLARHVEHQQHRQAQAARPDRRPRRSGPACPARRRTGPSRLRSPALRRSACVSAISASISDGGHRPGVEIDALGAGRRGMERRIDVVGPGLRRAHRDALAARSAPSRPSVTSGLARARARRRDDQAACAHRAASASATSCSSRSRTATMSPITIEARQSDSRARGHRRRAGPARR